MLISAKIGPINLTFTPFPMSRLSMIFNIMVAKLVIVTQAGEIS